MKKLKLNKSEGGRKLSPYLKLSNYKLRNLYYILQAMYRGFIKKEYNRIYSPDNIDDMLYKVSQCPDCYLNGSCISCGCPMNEMLNSDKSCPDGKF